jgi:hypothetical protein
VNIEKIINEIDERVIELRKATGLSGLTVENHNDIRFCGFLHESKKCIHCMDKREFVNILKRKEILFRKL